ncbi:hypothetical protein NSQ54_06295 [Alkalihalobacillus sp. FSL W8-0930]
MEGKRDKNIIFFFNKLNRIKEGRRKDNNKLLSYSLRLLDNNQLELLEIEQIDELICVSESSKSDHSQPRISVFLSSIAIILAIFISIFNIQELESIEETLFILTGLMLVIVTCVIFAVKLEQKRLKRYSDICYFSEKLRQAKEKLKT